MNNHEKSWLIMNNSKAIGSFSEKKRIYDPDFRHFPKLLARFPRKNKLMIRIFDIPRSGRSLFPPKAHPGPPRASSGPGLGQGEIRVGPGVTDFTICCIKQWFLQIWNSPADPPDPADPLDPPDPPDQVSGAAVRDLPSTRAGGQDDVSSKQTPSNHKGGTCGTGGIIMG